MGRLMRDADGGRLPGPLPLPVDAASREERLRRVADIKERLERGRYQVAPALVAEAILREHGVSA